MGICSSSDEDKRKDSAQKKSPVAIEAIETKIEGVATYPMQPTQEASSNIYSDADLQMLRQKIELPRLWCPNQNECMHICSKQNCPEKNILLCSSDTCNSCRNQHLGHNMLSLRDIIQLIQKQTTEQREFVLNILEMQTKILQSVMEFRKTLVKKYIDLQISEKYQPILDYLFKRNNSIKLDRQLVQEMVDGLEENIKTGKNRNQGSILLKEFEKKMGQIASDLNSQKEDFIKAFSYGFKLSSKLSQSKIIPQGSIKFIEQALNRPKQLLLLFRASEHQFLASEFHKKCDNIPHTFTVIKTEFGKTIAGYTPLQWNSANCTYSADNTNSSFLLSIDLQQKMTLTDPSKAIFCYSIYGPTFGGHDIYIADKCDANNSGAAFPTSYNYNGSYQKNQQTYTAFCGVTNGRNFKVVEYEVYRVVW